MKPATWLNFIPFWDGVFWFDGVSPWTGPEPRLIVVCITTENERRIAVTLGNEKEFPPVSSSFQGTWYAVRAPSKSPREQAL